MQPLLLLAQDFEIITLFGNNWAMCEVRETLIPMPLVIDARYHCEIKTSAILLLDVSQ